ncbi:MAG: transcriptional repressor [Candidatus Fermentibacteraceae bacterium]|nr:transcriptional repressor [Candidatus Fermentibacteraceae bacterium]MBN2607924.1 transcriptional repressor [Candidatus Fermentibacteraceae bacterium]
MPHCHTYLKKLRDLGYRITPQREMVIHIIAHSGRHMSAEEVTEEAKKRSEAINVATVYRTLDLLVENGLASKLDLGDGKTAYATGEHGPHIHLVCRQCGCVTEISDGDISVPLRDIEEKYSFDCHPYHFSIHGICRNCRERTN